MRTISGSTISLLAGRQALEPVFVLTTGWGGIFADRDIPNVAPGKILSVTGFDSTSRLDGGGSSSQVTIKLDDIDGSLKSVFNGADIHKMSASLYQWFWGVSFSEKFLVLSGVISSPIVWDEGERSFSFDIVSRLESREIGFSAEDGIFPSIPYNMLGTPWPMIFGKVVHAPGLQLQEIPTAFTATHMAFPDESLMAEFHRQSRHAEVLRYQSGLANQNATNYCFGSGSDHCDDDAQWKAYAHEAQSLMDQATQADDKASEYVRLYVEQSQFPNSAALIPSNYVTQKYEGVLRVGSNLFNGRLDKDGGRVTGPPLIKPGTIPHLEEVEGSSVLEPPPERTGFNFIQAGTNVAIAGNYPIQFLISMIPGTVSKVWAYRSTNGLRTLNLVPESWYEVKGLGYGGGGDAVIVELKMPLSVRAYLEEEKLKTWENNYGKGLPLHVVNSIDWEDQIYVTFTSSVGPNPIDIISWILDTYCPGLTKDDTTFSDVASKLANYPMNFIYNQRSDAIQFIKDIAYQCRCAIWIDTDIVYIRYLSETPTPVDTITMDDIVVDSMKVTSTTTEELVTKYTATFKPDYLPAFSDPIKLILRNNIAKYGMQEESFDYYAYSAYSYVEKTATFWLIRKSNTWKLLQCKLFITKLNLETMDAVTLDFGSNTFIANGPVTGIINSANYNSDDNTIDCEIWLPVRLGEMTPYSMAWPASATASASFPTERDVSPGGGGSIGGGQFPASNSTQVTAQGGSPSRGGAGDATANNTPDEFPGYDQPLSWGDPTPSDANDEIVPIEVRESPSPIAFDQPEYDYQYDPFDKQDPLPDAPKLVVAPGKIIKKLESDDTDFQHYSVLVYLTGLKQKGTVMEIKQLQLDSADSLPGETWVIVCCRTYDDPDTPGATKVEKTMQVPVWLK